MKISRRRKHQEHPKEKNSDPKTKKLPETTQGEEPRKSEKEPDGFTPYATAA